MRKYILFLLVLSTSLLSCEKEHSYPDLEGTWVSDDFPDLTFVGTTFVSKSASITHPELQYSLLKGNYTIKGNKIQFTVTQTESLDQIFYKDMKVPKITNVTMSLMDNATFKLKGKKLTIYYTSYPNDAPLATKAIFTRR